MKSVLIFIFFAKKILKQTSFINIDSKQKLIVLTIDFIIILFKNMISFYFIINLLINIISLILTILIKIM
jgi:hypothetical protein